MSDDLYKNPQSRKWLLTINNPIDKGYTHERIKDILEDMKLVYWCMSDETGEEGTYHTHIFLMRHSPIKAKTLHNKLKGAHRDIARGTCQENRDYVFKEGKWLHDKKSDTNHRDTHEEWGEMPIERPGARNDLTDLYDMIKEGKSNFEILESNPSYMTRLDDIEHTRQVVLEEKYKEVWRELDVTYIWGVTGTGKTKSVMKKYGYSKTFRVTDYAHPFDGYKGQDVIVFDEFRSSLKLGDMLDYLDGYPVELRARYVNRQACYTKVFIISNIDLRAQYPDCQREDKKSWEAFLRRIHMVQVFTGKETVVMNAAEYLSTDFRPCFESPFKEGKEELEENE